MFVDKVKILVSAGKGGNGAVAFHREKYVAAGGPDGGDGGHGGSVILQVNDHMTTLMDFRYRRKYVAASGGDGQGGLRTGKRGENLVIQVPRGTVVRDAETQQIIVDMSGDEPFVLAKGGRGGWGNKHFATPTRQLPRFAKAGLPGESREVILELKLLADVGWLPECGKIHAVVRYLQCPAKNRQLPLYHAVSKSGRYLCGRGRILCRGRYSWHY